MLINCIVPFSRTHQIDNVINNFKRQTYNNKRLIIVKNGSAINMKDNCFPYNTIILSSKQSPADAKNTAIHWLRENDPDSILSIMDDDDYYGKNYLTESFNSLEENIIIGKHHSFVRYSDGLYLYDCNSNCYADWIGGNTTTLYVKDMIDFPDIFCGEDLEWCKLMLAKGYKFKLNSINNFIYDRVGDKHTLNLTEKMSKIWLGTNGINLGHVPNEWCEKNKFNIGKKIHIPADHQIFEDLRNNSCY